MTTLDILTRKLARLQDQAGVSKTPDSWAIILYNPDIHDAEWKQAEIARLQAAHVGYIKAIILMPEKKPLDA